MEIKIIYTTDTHGRLSAYDFLNKNYGNFGLSRLPSYLNKLTSPYLLLDNGDSLQGSPLLDYTRKNKLANPVAKVFNALNYNYVTVGNHDFNYGLPYLRVFQKQFKHDILAANIFQDNKPLFMPYAICELSGLRIGIIGLITEYTPFWEKPSHIKDLQFIDVITAVKKTITDNNLKAKTDLIVVLYHGGFDPEKTYGIALGENKAYELLQMEEIDILLTGHQHEPQIHKRNNRLAMQTSANATDFGVITIDFINEAGENKIKTIDGTIIPLANYKIDEAIEALISDEIAKTNLFLSETIGFTNHDMTITSPLSCRIKKHHLFQLINQVQLDYTKADISAASLPNDTHGFLPKITLNDIAANFPFENDLVILEITGLILKAALENNARYFILENDTIVVNPKFLFPKKEHYNYDVYDGIDYIINVSKPLGERITNLTFKGQPVKPEQTFTLALTSYRAFGSGGFEMFLEAKKIASFPVSYFTLIADYIKKSPTLDFTLNENYKVIK
ncbi:MAG TPA: bifunctional UDP-sugar hydrolase/5'-nucleotidase [Bacilli bacterium]|nr:bifunctional UDP-sugar hydrolase/5'-nucleotidase [Bacilli bacterium]